MDDLQAALLNFINSESFQSDFSLAINGDEATSCTIKSGSFIGGSVSDALTLTQEGELKRVGDSKNLQHTLSTLNGMSVIQGEPLQGLIIVQGEQEGTLLTPEETNQELKKYKALNLVVKSYKYVIQSIIALREEILSHKK